jgi:ABC-2 type transport system permease protein
LNLYLANPMCDVVLAFQRALWPGGRLRVKDGLNADGSVHFNYGRDHIYAGNLYGRLGILLAVCLVLLWLAQRVFARAQGNFAQEL